MNEDKDKGGSMYKECRFIKANGLKCGSPAMRCSAFCYFHARKRVYVAPPSRDIELDLPPLKSEAAIHVALNQIFQALAAGKLDPKRAGNLLYILQMAQKTIYSAPSLPPSPDH